MKLVTYPLDGVTYSAEDVAAYLCTRTSGVYSRDSNFAVTVSGPREITVSPGLAWINYDDFKGISVCARERGTLTVPDADDMLPRIDRVVLQFDANANLTALKLKPGTPKAEPTAPELIRTHFIYELCLCEISVPAGSAEITAASLTDTRADEALCGLMRDGVTGIPMDELGQQALAKAKETAKLCDKLLASYSGGYLGIWPVTLTAEGWAECTDVPGYAYKQTAALRAARAATVPSAVPSPETYTVAVTAGLAGVCETGDGTITFWAGRRISTSRACRWKLSPPMRRACCSPGAASGATRRTQSTPPARPAGCISTPGRARAGGGGETMASCLISDAPYAAWLSDVLATLEEHKVTKIAVAAPLPGGEVFTGYYDMSTMDKALMATNIQADATMGAICANGSRIQRAWDAAQDEDDPEEEGG